MLDVLKIYVFIFKDALIFVLRRKLEFRVIANMKLHDM